VRSRHPIFIGRNCYPCEMYHINTTNKCSESNGNTSTVANANHFQISIESIQVCVRIYSTCIRARTDQIPISDHNDPLLIITTRCQPLRHNVEEFIQNHSFFCPNSVEKKKKKKNWASLGLVGVKFLGENKFLGGVFLFQNSVRLVFSVPRNRTENL
jgi:hypothetical protein